MLAFKAAEKSLGYNLCSVYGISKSRALELGVEVGVRLDTKVSDISKAKLNVLYDSLSSLNNLNSSKAIHKNLSRFVRGNVSRLIKINSYKGRRHKRGLPTRGQRTRTNGRGSKCLM